jgi:predicted Fe-Mo cluster-binding NifX family protein
MKIAVSSQNFRTITGHAGKAQRFLIYQVNSNGEVVELERLEIPQEMTFHELRGSEVVAHPLDQVKVLITGGAGVHFVQCLAQRGIEVCITAESEPLQAIRGFLTNSLVPQTSSSCDCHDHHHSV